MAIIEVPTPTGPLNLNFEPGSPVVFLGPNGSGKSRLGIYIDDNFEGPSHRLAAQRSLELPDEILSESYDSALRALLRDKKNKKATERTPAHMSYDFDQVVVALFAEHYRALELAHQKSVGRKSAPRPTTLIERLQKLWQEIIPYQGVQFSEGAVLTVRGQFPGVFSASQMSDGEREIFYAIAQALLIPTDGLLIVDEPELHVNRALIAKLWDSIEDERPDCAFLYVTHDVEFAASRRGGRNYAIQAYTAPIHEDQVIRGKARSVAVESPKWEIAELPEGTDLPSDLIARIVGSRKPVLFVEGKYESIDFQLYRLAYEDYTVIPVASCAQVIQLVRGFRAQPSLHWLDCRGLVDRDHRSPDQSDLLEDGIYVLRVKEVENLFFVPEIFKALAALSSFNDKEATTKLGKLDETLFRKARERREDIALKHTSERIFNFGKGLGIKRKTIEDLSAEFEHQFAQFKPLREYESFLRSFDEALASKDKDALLKMYDNKGMVAEVASALEQKDVRSLLRLVDRKVKFGEATGFIRALKSNLPVVQCQ
ncbi:DUF4435 domain-containing protein [Rhizobium leguminosarum]|uniref:DUF4435 domain-containing protein n=1 Tax=Rhizobium leguminosarum TaxID=384 RepID=UPI0013EE7E81|nr:DUF4435 domain-containing protein [Rhizobium leguminosarum]